jgi:homoserine dehydrogenase
LAIQGVETFCSILKIMSLLSVNVSIVNHNTGDGPQRRMKQYRLCFLGFGNVGRALARLLVVKTAELRDLYGIEWLMTGVGSRRLGWLSNEPGFEIPTLLASDLGPAHKSDSILEWLAVARPDVVFETTSLNVETGQPASDYLRAALQSGAHAITANKGTVVHAFAELSELARTVDRRYLFEATVLDSAPIFSLFRETLPAVRLRSFSGVFNSTTNVILEAIETGRTFDEGVKAAQELGVAETDPSNDVDGWDATVKVCALTRVLMNSPLKPVEVRRAGIRGLDEETLRAARAEGRPYKLVARARVAANGSVSATVQPEQLAATDPLSIVRGTSLAAHFELDMIPGLTIMSHRPNLQSTAYGLLADFVNAVRQKN